MRPVDSRDLSLRQLRTARCIAEKRGLAAAAAALNRTPSAVSRSLAELEAHLGVKLFDRFARGMEPTLHGRLLVARIEEVEAQLALAAKAHATLLRHPAPPRHNPVFSLETSHKRFRAFLAVHASRNVGHAATAVGLTRAAVYDSLRTLEDLLELPLFESGPAGLRSTPFADILASCLMLAFAVIQHGLDELASLDGVTHGRVVIGTLPYARTWLVPRAIDRVLLDHPRLGIATREGPYDALERALRNGQVDLIIGATRPLDAHAPLRTEALFEDELAVICGARHPFAGRARVAIEELLRFGWVLPIRSTPARQLFDRFLERHGVAEPDHVVETGSLSAARGLLLHSDRVALLSVHQIQLDRQAGLLTVLPIRLEETFRPIGMTTRAHTTPSPAARLVMQVVRDLAASPQFAPVGPGALPRVVKQ